MSINMGSKQYIITLCKRSMGLLFFMFLFQHCLASPSGKKKKGVEDTMTVAAIRQTNNNEPFIQVTFNQSQRFYKLPNDADPTFLNLLKKSEKDHIPLVIKRAKGESDVILGVRKP